MTIRLGKTRRDKVKGVKKCFQPALPLYPTNKLPLSGMGRGFIRSTNVRTICNKIHSGRFKELAPGLFGIKKETTSAAVVAALCLSTL